MRKDATRLAVLCLFLLAPAGAAAPVAQARPVIGIGDQKPAMFTDPRFEWLNITYSRMVVSWDVRRVGWERPWVKNWLAKARAARVRPLIAFGHTWTEKGRRYLPTVREYRREVRAFRRAYPWVREYTPWNEANHCSQPTCNRPERAAAYYKVLKQECRRCTILAADVLDQAGMVEWLRRFRRAARPYKPRLWGLHNYLDANRRRSTGTRRLLKAVPGQIWFTETGGLVRRNHYRAQISFPESPEHAAKATRWVLKLATARPRVRRVYFYHWDANSPTQAWDSAFIDPYGNPRPAFDVLARFRGRDPRRAPLVFQPFPPGPAPPSEQPPPETGTQPQPEPQPQQPPADCLLGVFCP